ncbi:DUF3267 domain-containing protein [Gracilibacillus dipsosauri]|uniref:DUF3267 domain-containing protein n=1 Tax=Gracilibacillus dipsosauri TaxID=178340 RepID=A0A317KU10_9BACI|nr:DUF3267 domain-containing protein [Gracilibacillus dipsosauri]
MNCWDSINVTKQLGFYRSMILSLLFGFLSFILLYLPFNFIHENTSIREYGLFPLIVGLAILPLLHKFLHIVPLKCANKHLKLKWSLKLKVLPYFEVCSNTKTSKPVLLIGLLAPTIFITIPCVIMGYLSSGYYPYFILFGAINLSLSYVDFVYVNRLWRAPRHCVIANDDRGYDILIQK